MEDSFKIKILNLVQVSPVAMLELHLLTEMEDSLMKEIVSSTPSSDTL